MKKIQNIIFDFDGTIADSFEFLFQIYNQISDKFGFLKVKKEEVDSLKGKSYKYLIKRFKIPIFRIPSIITEGRSLLNKQIRRVKVCKGMKKLLKELNIHGYKIGILTTNSKENIYAFLAKEEMEDLIDFVYSSKNFFQKSKVIKKILKEKSLEKEATIYIGDEVRDIKAAKDAGIETIAVSWGFNKKEILEKENPNFIIDKPNQLMKILQS